MPPVPEANSGSESSVPEQGTRFSKIRQTLSSSLMTAQDKSKYIIQNDIINILFCVFNIYTYNKIINLSCLLI